MAEHPKRSVNIKGVTATAAGVAPDPPQGPEATKGEPPQQQLPNRATRRARDKGK